MKTLAVVLALCLGTAAVADDALVDASKAAKSKRKKSTTKVITNADVKKSKAKLIEGKAAATEVPKPGPGLVEQFEAAKQARAITAEKLAAIEQVVALLEKELAAIEQRYYDENDLQRRDSELVPRFNETKKKLDAARAELDTLRPAAPPEAPTPPPAPSPTP